MTYTKEEAQTIIETAFANASDEKLQLVLRLASANGIPYVETSNCLAAVMFPSLPGDRPEGFWKLSDAYAEWDTYNGAELIPLIQAEVDRRKAGA